MKIFAYLALTASVIGFLTWTYNQIYDAGITDAALTCAQEKQEQSDDHVLQLNAVIDRERKANEATDDIARAFHDTIIVEVEKNAGIQKQLSDKPVIEKCSQDDAGDYVAYLSSDSIRMLNQCSQATALPETQKQSFVSEDKVTSTDLARYTCRAISEYNRCAIEVNKAIEEFNVRTTNHAE